MDKDIEILNDLPNCNESVNLSEIGKYDKFINFVPMPKEYDSMVLFPKYIPFMFHNNEMVKEKLSDSERFLAMVRMKENLMQLMEEKLKENHKLQNKIKIIKDKARKKIYKLKEKPLNKLKKEYGYERFEEYFKPKFMQDSSEEFSFFSETLE